MEPRSVSFIRSNMAAADASNAGDIPSFVITLTRNVAPVNDRTGPAARRIDASYT